MNTEEQDFLLTGKIISMTREIESRMADCGATGNGLREKTESLGSKLPPEAVKLSIYIGNIRNKLAHESDPHVSAEEFELFEEAAQMLIEFLGRLHEAQNPAPPAETTEQNGEVKEIRNGETPSAVSKTRLFAFLPLAHLGFGGELFWKSFCQAWEYLLLFVTELLAVFAIIYSVWHGAFGAYFGAGAALLVFCWLISIWDKFRRSDTTLYGRLALFPLTNIAYLAVCLWKNFVPFYFIAALAVFGCMAGGIYFLILREWHIAAICAGMIYLVSVIAGFLTRGEKSE